MYRIILTAPFYNLSISGMSRSVEAGQPLVLSERDGENLINGVLKNRCIVVEHILEQTAESDPSLAPGYDPYSQNYGGVTPFSEDVPTLLPEVKDPLAEAYKQALNDVSSQVVEVTVQNDQPVETPPDPQDDKEPTSDSQTPVSAELDSLNPETLELKELTSAEPLDSQDSGLSYTKLSVEAQLLPIESTWTQVLKQVTNLRKEVPINYELILATKERFHTYVRVVQECDNILASQIQDT
jgi:hypothetical protein